MQKPLSDNTKSKTEIRWYVMIAYKQESEAERVLSGDDGLEFFIARHYIVQEFHGKKKLRLVPVIPNVVFVHASQVQLVHFKEKYNFIKFSTWNTSDGIVYLTVSDKEMNDFIRVSRSNEDSLRYFTPSDLDLKKGTKVKVHGGQFDGIEGTFLRIKGKRSRQVVVILPNVLAVSVEVQPDLVEPLE